MIQKYLDKNGVAYCEFSLAGSDRHTGMAYIPSDKVKEEWYGDVAKARECIQSELDIIDQWMNGEIYGFTVEDPRNKSNEDSCWGFYGLRHCLEAAKESADYMASKKDKELDEALLV